MLTQSKMVRFSLACLVALAATAPAQAVQYQITSLPVPGVGQNMQLFGINSTGQIAGSIGSATGQQAFIYSAGVFTPVSGPAGALGAAAFGINDSGKIVGSYYDTQTIDPATGLLTIGPTHGFILSGGNYTRFDVPNANFTQARGLSPDGRYVTGYSTDTTGRASAFVYDTSTSSFIDLTRPNSINAFAQGMNAAGLVAGSDILTQPGSPSQRVGFTYNINTGQYNDFSFAGYTRTAFRGINSSGVIAGWLQRPNASGVTVTVGFVGSPTAYDLITVPGATDTIVQAINDVGVVSGYYTVDGQAIGFVATPVPEPQSLALMLCGVLALAGVARRQQVRHSKV
jgi:uncharacterized membrane protein